MTFITTFRNFSILAPKYFTRHFCPPTNLKLTRHTDIKFKRQKGEHFRRVTSKSGVPIFFCYRKKMGMAMWKISVTFWRIRDRPKTRGSTGDTVPWIWSMYNICAFQWPVAIVLRGETWQKKNWHIVKNAIYTLKNHVTWVQFETSCLLHISFRNWDIHVNHIREYCQLCVSVVSYHANGVWISVKVYPLFQNIFTRHRPYKCSSSLGPQASTYWQDKPFFTCCQSNGSRITARHW